MIHYLLKNSSGDIVQRGCCLTDEEIPRVAGLTHEIIDPEDSRAPAGVQPTYRDFRAMDYPGVGNQLDALWKIIEAAGLGSLDPDGMLARVKEVKSTHPKS